MASNIPDLKLVALLIEKGADVDGGVAILSSRYVHVIKFLLENGSNINVKSFYGETVLMRSVETDADFVRLLIEKGADLNAKNKYGKTVLTIAEVHGFTEIAKLLTEKGTR